MRALLRVSDAALLAAAIQALRELEWDAVAEDGAPAVVFAEIADGAALDAALATAHTLNAALVAALPPDANVPADRLARVHEWLRLPAGNVEIRDRLRAAAARNALAVVGGPAADLDRYRDLLFDHRTGLPTLPVMIESARDLLERRGQLTVLYIHFVWYEKIEESFGWQKLDEVLETTAAAVRGFYGEARTSAENIIMVSHVADDDFILFTHTPAPPERVEHALRDISQRLEADLRQAIEAVHGEDIATLCGIYVGASTVFRNPRIRTERLIYRGIREASQAARGAEQWERSRMVNDLRTTIREGAVFIEYHPIIVTATREVFGFEALARGIQRELRSPEVLFEVAEQANLVWELSRLLRQRAVEGIVGDLEPGQCLFLNVDPHDFDDPAFRNLSAADLGIEDAGRVVLEITERTAIRDYPRFRDHLAAFRERGFRFAVDDAGSGYAGLGSIANLAPDFIKLDISLIANIDANLLKQSLVQTMVAFAENHGAQVVAEGVERPEEFETILALGVHFTQGFLFHKLRYTGPPEPPGAPVSHAGMRRGH